MTNLEAFINKEKEYFKSMNLNINWSDSKWEVSEWLPHRGQDHSILFKTIRKITKTVPDQYFLPIEEELPFLFSEFSKAVIVNIVRRRNIGYMSARNYVIACRRIHVICNMKNDYSPENITLNHCNELMNFLKGCGYSETNLYDSSKAVKVIVDILNKNSITSKPIKFIYTKKSPHRYHDYTPLSSSENDTVRKGKKLPSKEAFMAYAECTNNPINNYEEILLRTIDLLIATGQRANEVAYLPYDCWVVKEKVDENGQQLKDVNGKVLVDYGLRYYAVKPFQTRVHWLAEQDVDLAKRSIERLKELTLPFREIVKFHENNPGRLWDLDPESLISDDELLEYFGFNNVNNLHLNFDRKGIKAYLVKENTNRPYFQSGNRLKRYTKQYIYKVSEIEKCFAKNHKDFIINAISSTSKLMISDILSIRPEGAFRFKRKANTIKVDIGVTKLSEINRALGSYSNFESTFDRRGLKELDGGKIILKSHDFRHWRNTLYEKGGMSNVQQALAMGRKDLAQNVVYQHTNEKERTNLQRDFIEHNSIANKVEFLHDGIKNKAIVGDLTDTYHSLLKNKEYDNAEMFLKTQASAMHITPYGACTHDFSQHPCKKHLACWDNCSHLHLTGAKEERENLEDILNSSKKSLDQMRKESDIIFGKDKWIEKTESLINNIEKGLSLTTGRVFPDGDSKGINFNNKRNDSV